MHTKVLQEALVGRWKIRRLVRAASLCIIDWYAIYFSSMAK